MVQYNFVLLLLKMKKRFFHLTPASEGNRDLKQQAESQRAFHSIPHKYPSGFFLINSLHFMSTTYPPKILKKEHFMKEFTLIKTCITNNIIKIIHYFKNLQIIQKIHVISSSQAMCKNVQQMPRTCPFTQGSTYCLTILFGRNPITKAYLKRTPKLLI